MEVVDLFNDIKDGTKLIALLQLLSGQKLVRKLRCSTQSDKIFLRMFCC